MADGRWLMALQAPLSRERGDRSHFQLLFLLLRSGAEA